MDGVMNISCQEVEIPVPWGHVAGKLWGNSNGRPLLALHGRQDNCGVFDRIVPSLRGDYHSLAIDLPGHGLSSHCPSDVPLDFLNYVIALVYVLKFMQWERVLLLGHSMGGQVGFFLSAAFPEYVEKMILIDPISTFDRDQPVTKLLRSRVEEFIKLEVKLKTGNEPEYTYEHARHKLVNRSSALTKEAAEIVLKRALKKMRTGYNFRMDQRLKMDPLPFITVPHLLDLFSNIQCPVLSILSSEKFMLYEKTYRNATVALENYTETVIDGNHDFHQNHPEKVCHLIDEFFENKNSKL